MARAIRATEVSSAEVVQVYRERLEAVTQPAGWDHPGAGASRRLGCTRGGARV